MIVEGVIPSICLNSPLRLKQKPREKFLPALLEPTTDGHEIVMLDVGNRKEHSTCFLTNKLNPATF